jgi:hypothetical protein
MKLRWNAPVAAAVVVAALFVTKLLAASPGTGTPMKPDQVNTATWDKGWTNLVNDVEQTFTPTAPKLLAVEVELVVGNPGSHQDKLILTVLDSRGNVVVSLPKIVSDSDFEHTLFVIPDGGIDVNPGQTYSIKLSGGPAFGWKYVVGGYSKGAATFNGKPLLPDARSTFLFRTFGPE